jgi:hypothetical protein
MLMPAGHASDCALHNGPADFIDAADIPLAAEHGVVRAILVDPGAKAGRAELERHQIKLTEGGTKGSIVS